MVRPFTFRVLGEHTSDDLLEGPVCPFDLPVGLTIPHRDTSVLDAHAPHHSGEEPHELSPVIRGYPGGSSPGGDQLPQTASSSPAVLVGERVSFDPLRKGVLCHKQVAVPFLVRGKGTNEVNMPALKGPLTFECR